VNRRSHTQLFRERDQFLASGRVVGAAHLEQLHIAPITAHDCQCFHKRREVLPGVLGAGIDQVPDASPQPIASVYVRRDRERAKAVGIDSQVDHLDPLLRDVQMIHQPLPGVLRVRHQPVSPPQA